MKNLFSVLLSLFIGASLVGCGGGGGGGDAIDESGVVDEGTVDEGGGDEGGGDEGGGDEGTVDEGGVVDEGTVDEGGGDGAGGENSDLPAGEPLGLVLPRVSIEASELGVIVNTDDPLSIQIAQYYVAARNIPPQNVLQLSMGSAAIMSAEDFTVHEAAINAAFGDEIQAIALTSMTPYRVDCMSVSAAVALGFDLQYCQAGPPCLPTAAVDYFNSWSSDPWLDHSLRPTMIIAAETYADAVALIDRGVEAQSTYPDAKGWLVRTTDISRSVRYNDFAATDNAWQGVLDLEYIDNSGGGGSNLIENEALILFYFTGLSDVGGLDSNTYRPGAIADHLTSAGGSLPTSSQMSILEWIQGGVTASYGTALEPCNYTTKFPQISVLLPHYFRGESVVEAYWKSVHWPGEGNFVGEPLARPWAGAQTNYLGGSYTITTTLLQPGVNYDVEYGPTQDGPWTLVINDINVTTWDFTDLIIDEARVAWYRVVRD